MPGFRVNVAGRAVSMAGRRRCLYLRPKVIHRHALRRHMAKAKWQRPSHRRVKTRADRFAHRRQQVRPGDDNNFSRRHGSLFWSQQICIVGRDGEMVSGLQRRAGKVHCGRTKHLHVVLKSPVPFEPQGFRRMLVSEAGLLRRLADGHGQAKISPGRQQCQQRPGQQRDRCTQRIPASGYQGRQRPSPRPRRQHGEHASRWEASTTVSAHRWTHFFIGARVRTER